VLRSVDKCSIICYNVVVGERSKQPNRWSYKVYNNAGNSPQGGHKEIEMSKGTWRYLWTTSRGLRTADVYVRTDVSILADEYKVILRDRLIDFDQTDKELSLDECRETAEDFVTGAML
jgi:hypothetical protein